MVHVICTFTLYIINIYKEYQCKTFSAAVSEELRRQTVCTFIQHLVEVLSSKKRNSQNNYGNEFTGYMHIYTLCPKYILRFTKLCAVRIEKKNKTDGLTDFMTGLNTD